MLSVKSKNNSKMLYVKSKLISWPMTYNRLEVTSCRFGWSDCYIDDFENYVFSVIFFR